MTLEEAVAAPGRKVQVTDPNERNGELALMIYSLGSDGAKQIAGKYVPKAEHGGLVADFKSRGVPVAESDYHCDFVWIRNADGIEVFDSNGKVLDAAGDRATLSDGTAVQRGDIARVITTASKDYIHRGIKAALRSGKDVDLVMEISMSAMGDPTYSRNELLNETGWCARLGAAIASWAGVGFEDKI